MTAKVLSETAIEGVAIDEEMTVHADPQANTAGSNAIIAEETLTIDEDRTVMATTQYPSGQRFIFIKEYYSLFSSLELIDGVQKSIPHRLILFH